MKSNRQQTSSQLEFPDVSVLPGAKSKGSRAKLAVCFSSRSDEWPTPPSLFVSLDSEFHFTLDPCSTHDNAKCRLHFTREEDGLKQHWGTHRVFMNPPYGREIGAWMQKAVVSARHGATVVCLVPARTDTEWWHDFALRGEIRFLKGRLKFGDAVNSAPFPSALVIFRPPPKGKASSKTQQFAPTFPFLSTDQ